MSNLKSNEEGFSEIITNPVGIPVKKESSHKIREEHTRWKQEVQQLRKEKSVKGMRYWQMVSSCAML